MNEEEELRDPKEVQADMQEVIDALLEMNTSITSASRGMAQNALKIREGYVQGAQLCEVLAKLFGESARLAANLTGDVIAAEWGLNDLEEYLEDDLDDDFDEDDD